jgi:hypothetical protein
MIRTALLCSASALIACGSAFAAGPMRPLTHARGEVHRVIAAIPGSATLYDQDSEDSGVGVVSTNFTHDFDSFDAYGADDFTIPTRHTWKIEQVEVTGIYGQGSNPAQSESVFFYRDNKGLPGELIAECDDLDGVDNQGSFAIKLPKSCKSKLKGGKRYWLSIVANENNGCCTWWGWETRSVLSGKPAAWENPSGRFGCSSWNVMTSCVGSYGEGPDFMFALKGKDLVQE